jgi:hypothetical protein
MKLGSPPNRHRLWFKKACKQAFKDRLAIS